PGRQAQLATILFPLSIRVAGCSSVPPGIQNQSDAPQSDHERGDTEPGDGVKAELLEKTDCSRKGQSSDKSKRQGKVVDLPFVLIIRRQKTQHE
ncbi:MAG: hypothetical protein WA274_04525, partial [Candidatus Acidiferrales bacterium]